MFTEAEENAISVQSSTSLKAEENFAWASETKTDEAEGRGGLSFTSYDYVHHLVSGQSLMTVTVRVKVRVIQKTPFFLRGGGFSREEVFSGGVSVFS